MVIKILLAIAALALGVWLGLPGRYTQTPEELDDAMRRGGARRNQVRRHFTPLDWLRKEQRGSVRRRQRRYFKTAASEDEGEA